MREKTFMVFIFYHHLNVSSALFLMLIYVINYLYISYVNALILIAKIFGS